jgi:hypothetical protein
MFGYLVLSVRMPVNGPFGVLLISEIEVSEDESREN